MSKGHLWILSVTGQIDRRTVCGNRFCVRDGTVQEKQKHEYTCPHCGGLVASNVTTGQIDHRTVCGNRFCVRDGTVKEKKKHEYTCPHCGGLVASNVTNSVRQPVLRHRWKGERPKEERAEDGRQEIAQRGRCGPREKGKWCATAQQGQFRPLEKKELVRQSPEPTVCATSPTVSHRAQSPQSSKCEVLERLKRPESRSMAEPLAICRGV